MGTYLYICGYVFVYIYIYISSLFLSFSLSLNVWIYILDGICVLLRLKEHGDVALPRPVVLVEPPGRALQGFRLPGRQKKTWPSKGVTVPVRAVLKGAFPILTWCRIHGML